MLGVGIVAVVVVFALVGALFIAGMIGIGFALGRGGPKRFHALGTGDYALYYLVAKDWDAENGKGTAWVLISRLGTKGMSFVHVPMARLRSYDNKQLSPMDVASMIFGSGVGYVLAEIVQKSRGYFLRTQRPTDDLRPPVAAPSVEEPAPAVASPAPPGEVAAGDEPSVSVANEPTLIIAADQVSGQGRPAPGGPATGTTRMPSGTPDEHPDLVSVGAETGGNGQSVDSQPPACPPPHL